MGKARRRTKAQRIEAHLTRSLQGQDEQLIELIQTAATEQERRRFWIRLGCPMGPLPQ